MAQLSVIQVDCLVTTAGGIEEDFIKCMASTYLGDFTLKGRELREKGINRIGNLLVPNNNYCKFEDWLMPILNQMVKEQKEEVCEKKLSRIVTKPTKWHVRPVKTQISLGIRPV